MKSLYAWFLSAVMTLLFVGCVVHTESNSGSSQTRSPAPPIVHTSSAKADSHRPAKADPKPHHKGAAPVEPKKEKSDVNPPEPQGKPQGDNAKPVHPVTPVKPIGGNSADSTNPASTHCKKSGGQLNMVDTPRGQIGVCVFRDGSRCEEWAFYREQCAQGECRENTGMCPEKKDKKDKQKKGKLDMSNPASQHCKKNGGTVTMVNTPQGQIGVCIWRDGSRCEEWAFYRKQCAQGECRENTGLCSKKSDDGKDKDDKKDKKVEKIGMSNPASAHCKKKGGTVTMIDTPKGQVGVCIWRDGSRCEEWAFFRNQCAQGECRAKDGICPKKKGVAGMANPASQNCEKNGGQVKLVKDAKGQIGVCVFRDGSRCEEWRFLRDQCKQGECRDKNGMCTPKTR